MVSDFSPLQSWAYQGGCESLIPPRNVLGPLLNSIPIQKIKTLRKTMFSLISWIGPSLNIFEEHSLFKIFKTDFWKKFFNKPKKQHFYKNFIFTDGKLELILYFHIILHHYCNTFRLRAVECKIFMIFIRSCITFGSPLHP